MVGSEDEDVLGYDECVELGPWRKDGGHCRQCHEGTALEDDGGMKSERRQEVGSGAGVSLNARLRNIHFIQWAVGSQVRVLSRGVHDESKLCFREHSRAAVGGLKNQGEAGRERPPQ